jgi:uncharacterized protein (TIGR00730 family)
MDKINKLAIFCGSKLGASAVYKADAEALAGILAATGTELIYGGGKNGLMGVVADGVLQGGGIVRGVIPQVLTLPEHKHDSLTELLVVENMHLRKHKMYELCDAAIILPGGFGTLDELFEILTWNQLSIHDKKVFILNTSGFYTHLLEHLRLLAGEGFLYEAVEDSLIVLNRPEEIKPYLKES